MIDKLNPSLYFAYSKALEEAAQKDISIEENSVLKWLLKKNNVTLDFIFLEKGYNKELWIEAIEQTAKLKPKKSKKPNKKLEDILNEAWEITQNVGDDVILPETFVYCFLDNVDSCFTKALSQVGIDLQQVKIDLMNSFVENEASEEDLLDPLGEEKLSELSMTEINPILGRFAENLNVKALQGEYENIIDFNESQEALASILCRKKKSNVIIVGEPGTGKTSMVESLALEIVKGNAPTLLSNKVIYSVNLASMLAGTQYRGQFEQRLQEFIAEAKKYYNLVLFIDEIHTLMGAGVGSSESNSLDASNMLKPELAKGTISVIGATTMNEYRNTIRKDGAMDRRFEMIVCKEPNRHQMLDILTQIKGYYEEHHSVEYDSDILECILDHCDLYMPHRNYPDKAVDVLDQVGAICKTKHYRVPDDIREMEKFLKDGNEPPEEMVAEYAQKFSLWATTATSMSIKVTRADIISYFKNRESPIFKSVTEEFININRKKLIGQNKFLDQFHSLIEGIKCGILEKTNPNAPRSFLVLGAPGTGKTIFSNLLKKEVESHAGNCIYINGLEYKDPYNIYKFNGNTGNRSSGSICDQVSLQPNSILIIDGVDQACDHFLENVERILLDGKVKNANGDTVDFSNTFLFLVSSVKGQSSGASIGFSNNPTVTKAATLDGTNISKLGHSVEFILNMEELREQHIRRLAYERLNKIKKNLNLMGKSFCFDFSFLKKISSDYVKNKKLGGRHVHSVFSNKIDKFVIEQVKRGNSKIELKEVEI